MFRESPVRAYQRRMGRPPQEVRAQIQGDRFGILYAEEGRWHFTSETDPDKALAWVRWHKESSQGTTSTFSPIAKAV